jgi:putative oxidoreductase
MATPTEILLLAGRIILGAYFLYAGINHFRQRKVMAGYAASKKVPFPMLSILGTGALLTLGGASLITGILPFVGLAFIALFLVGVTPMMHNFWTIQDPMQRMGERANFLKNAALLGAILAIAAVPQPWSYSVAFAFGV